jgi:hypothetical protein
MPPTPAFQQTYFANLRLGLGAFVPSPSTQSEDARPHLETTVRVNQTVEGTGGGVRAQSVDLSLPMFGPEDVVALDPAVIARVWPIPDVDDAEANYFPLLEFSEPDLPWRYSPPGPARRLLPWLALVVLREDEVTLEPSDAHRAVAAAVVHEGTPLPDLTQSWAWAHVDVQGDATGDPHDAVHGLAPILANSPARAASRLIAPRRLHPATRYVVLLVPVFERARAGLLGETPQGRSLAWTGTRAPAPSAPAGGGDRLPFRLPVYHQWRFGTGAEGDFETLAMRLGPPSEAITGLGRRAVRVGELPRDYVVYQHGNPVTTFEIGGAIRPLETPPAWPVEVRALPGPGSLATVLNDAARLTTNPEVGPPFYARWLAATRTVVAPLPSPPAPQPPWLESVNLDLSFRVAAGVGARVVQEQQEALMSGAWAQLEGIRRINEELRFSQVSREASARLYCRDFHGISPGAFLALTAPVHAHVLCGGRTIEATLAASPLVPGSLDPQWRRLARPRGPLARRQGRTGRALTPYERMNAGTLVAARPPRPPRSLNTSATLLDPKGKKTQGGAAENPIAGCPDLPLFAQILLCQPPSRFGADPGGLLERARKEAAEGHCQEALRTLGELLEGRGAPPDFRPTVLATEGAEGGEPLPPVSANSILHAFQPILRDQIEHPPAEARAPGPIDLLDLVACLRAALDPRRTIARAVQFRLSMGPGVHPCQRGLDERVHASS